MNLSAFFGPARRSPFALLALAGYVGACEPFVPPALASQRPPAPTSSLHRAEPTTAEEVLDLVRSKLNYPAIAGHTAGIMMRGTSLLAGVEGGGSLLFDPLGHALSEVTGPFGSKVGYDGTTAWERNETGVPRVLSLSDREVRIAIFEFLSCAWLSNHTTLTFALDAAATDQHSFTLSFARDGTNINGTVRIDRASGEPRTILVRGASHPETIELSDYADFKGARLFRKVVSQSADNPPSIFQATEIVPAPTFIRSPYEPLLNLPDNFHFDPAVSPRVEIRKAPTQHHLVKAIIDGQDMGYFIFDSGAGTEVISLPVAEKLNLKPFGKIPVRGVGGSVDAAFYQPGTMTLGPITLDKPVFVGLDLSGLDPYMGVQVAGVIGYGVLGRTTTLVDAKESYLEIYDSSTYQLTQGSWTEVLLYGRHPAVAGSIEGHEGYLRLDTGAANSAITVHAPTVAQFNMLDDRELQDAQMGGVGGMVKAKAGVLSAVVLGGKTFQDVHATFALPDQGAMNDSGTLGNVGGVLLDHFVLVFDYPHQRMALIPRAEPVPTKDAHAEPTKADN